MFGCAIKHPINLNKQNTVESKTAPEMNKHKRKINCADKWLCWMKSCA